MLGAPHTRFAELGHGIRDGLDAGQRHRTRGEALQQDEDGERAPEEVSSFRFERQRVDVVDVVEHEASEQSVAHERAEDRDVDVRRYREDSARLLDPAQVGQADEDDQDEPQRDAVLGEILERRDRHDRGDAGRDRYRNGEDVVDE